MINLLILHEKHGNRYFSYNTFEELHKIALHILKERSEEDGWKNLYEVEAQRDKENQEKYCALKEYVKHVTHPTAVSLINKEVDDLSKEINHSKRIINIYKRAFDALEQNDGKKALEVLDSRRNWESNSISF